MRHPDYSELDRFRPLVRASQSRLFPNGLGFFPSSDRSFTDEELNLKVFRFQHQETAEQYYLRIGADLNKVLEVPVHASSSGVFERQRERPSKPFQMRGYKFPNGEFAIGRDYSGGLSLEQKAKKKAEQKKFEHKDDGLNLICPSSGGSSLKKLRKKRGTNGISRDGRRNLRNALYLLQEDYSKQRLGFLTLTCPSFSELDNLKLAKNLMIVLAKRWDKLVKKFNQCLVRQLIRKGAPIEYVAVTEIQEKRYRRHKQFLPHLHLCYVARESADSEHYYLSGGSIVDDQIWIRKAWLNILVNELRLARIHGETAFTDKQIQPFIDINSQSHEILKASVSLSEKRKYRLQLRLEIIKHDVCAYMSKYLSKSTYDFLDSLTDSDKELIPSCWYHMSRSFVGEHGQIQSSKQELPPEIVQMVTCLQFNNMARLGYFKEDFEGLPKVKYSVNRYGIPTYWGVLSEKGVKFCNDWAIAQSCINLKARQNDASSLSNSS